MAEAKSPSPAVSSLHEEQARQRTVSSELDEGLEETFPASDPVSQTVPTTVGSASRADKTSEDSSAPKVDEALEAVRERDGGGTSDFTLDEVKAMQAEVDALYEASREIASASGRVARGQAYSLRRDVAEQVRKHPLQAVSLAALVGYVWGMTR